MPGDQRQRRIQDTIEKHQWRKLASEESTGDEEVLGKRMKWNHAKLTDAVTEVGINSLCCPTQNDLFRYETNPILNIERSIPSTENV